MSIVRVTIKVIIISNHDNNDNHDSNDNNDTSEIAKIRNAMNIHEYTVNTITKDNEQVDNNDNYA
jgi:hypothetical protein